MIVVLAYPCFFIHHANLIEIPSYTVEQAFDILKERAEQALEKYTYSEDTLRRIAQITKGNVTLSFVLLKSLALKAESLDKDSLDDVELNYEVDCPDERLNRDEKILLHILEEWKSLFLIPKSLAFPFDHQKEKFFGGQIRDGFSGTKNYLGPKLEMVKNYLIHMREIILYMRRMEISPD